MINCFQTHPNTDFNKEKITIKKDEIEYPISREALCKINDKYDSNDLLAIIGGMVLCQEKVQIKARKFQTNF